MYRAPPRVLLLGIALATGLLFPASPATAQLCSETTSLTVLALDTASGKVLFSLPASVASGDESGNLLVEFDTNKRMAVRFPGFAVGERFGGSIGPGPILALSRCGEGCVQAQRWNSGHWSPVGGPLQTPVAANLHLLYDRSSTPWLTVHQLTDERGLTDVTAYRLRDDQWHPKGRSIVHAAGTPAVAPAPWRRDGIVSGSGLFSASEPPSFWVHGLPTTPEPNRGSLIALTETRAVFLAENGTLFYSDNLGASWVADKWRPWGVERTPLWTYGSDYSIDLPLGTLSDALPVVWFDQRPSHPPELHLAELEAGGRWKRLAESVPRVEGADGTALEVVTFLHTAAGRWLLLSDCHRRGAEAGFLLRSCPPTGLSAPRFVPILPSIKSGD